MRGFRTRRLLARRTMISLGAGRSSVSADAQVLYSDDLHQQALDTSTPSGRMLFGMLGVFSAIA